MHTKKTFPNGLRVLLAPRNDTDAQTVLILFKVGSRDEARNVNGISHFLEHLMFKGTMRRPTTLEISKVLDGIGAEYNAFTSKDYTGYYIKAASAKSDLLLDMLSDMLYNSILDPVEIDRERGVILEEINMYQDNPLMYLEDVFEELVYGKNTQLGQLIAGPKKNIRRVTRAQIKAYRKKHYTEANMVVIVAGKMNPQTTMKRIQKYFATSGKRARKKSTPRSLKITQAQPRVRVLKRKTEQTQIGLGFPAYSHFDKRLPALQLMSAILGGNMSSRLFIRIRERLGLCYMIKSSVNPYEDAGTFYVQSGLDRTRLELALARILDELKLLRDEGVGEDELGHAKEFFRGKLVLRLEDSEAIASWLGMQELLMGKVKTAEERMREIDAVTTKDVHAVARDVINRSRINLAIIGPYTTARPFQEIVRKSL